MDQAVVAMPCVFFTKPALLTCTNYKNNVVYGIIINPEWCYFKHRWHFGPQEGPFDPEQHGMTLRDLFLRLLGQKQGDEMAIFAKA